MKKLNTLISMISVLFLCVACTPTDKNTPAPDNTMDFTHCEEPRPQICTREYRPVCATKGTQEITYATGCTACSDMSVIKYRPGACE